MPYNRSTRANTYILRKLDAVPACYENTILTVANMYRQTQ